MNTKNGNSLNENIKNENSLTELRLEEFVLVAEGDCMVDRSSSCGSSGSRGRY